MKNNIKRIAYVFLSGAMLVGTLFSTPMKKVEAEGYWPNNIDVSAQAAIVMDEETGAILYQKNMDTSYYPASITKIVTALIALENCDLDEVVTFSHDAVFDIEKGSSSISRDVGEQMTMEQCLYGMLLESANECANAIAEHVCDGDRQAFIDLMNKKAKELGCTNTHFNNTNGLTDENHYVSAHDMALLAREAYKNKKFQEIIGTRFYNIPPTNKHSEETLLNNHHAMFSNYKTTKYLYEYCVGGKTGFTEAANSTLVTYAKKDNMTLVCVVLNDVAPGQYTDTINLFNYCFDNFSAYSVADTASLFENNKEKDLGSLADNIDLIKVSDEGVVILPKAASIDDATTKIVKTSSKDKNVIGQIQYYYCDRYVGGADLLYTNSKIESYPFHNIDEKNGGSKVPYIRIDFKFIFMILLIGAAILGLVYFIHTKSSDIILYKKRHIDSRKKQKSRYKKIRRNRRRKRYKKI